MDAWFYRGFAITFLLMLLCAIFIYAVIDTMGLA